MGYFDIPKKPPPQAEPGPRDAAPGPKTLPPLSVNVIKMSLHVCEGLKAYNRATPENTLGDTLQALHYVIDLISASMIQAGMVPRLTGGNKFTEQFLKKPSDDDKHQETGFKPNN